MPFGQPHKSCLPPMTSCMGSESLLGKHYSLLIYYQILKGSRGMLICQKKNTDVVNFDNLSDVAASASKMKSFIESHM